MLRTKKLLQLIFSLNLASVEFAVVAVAAVARADAVAILFLFIYILVTAYRFSNTANKSASVCMH